MADREEYQAGRVGGGISSFQGTPLPSAGQVRGLDFTSIRNALAGWQDKLFEEEEARVMEGLTNAALEAQHQMGIAGIANPDRQLAARYAQQYKKTAEALYMQQLSVDALKMDTKLRQQHQYDPDGYQKAWDEYTEGSIGQLKKENRQLYTASQAMLQEQGAKSWAGISNTAFQRQELEHQAAAIRNTQETLDVYADRMRDPEIDNAQRDIELAEGMNAVTINLNGLLGAGVINGAEYETFRQNAEDNLRTEWVTTNFNAAMARGDMSAAQGYITELTQGNWFVNNEKADELAAGLASSIPDTSAAHSKYKNRMAKQEASMLEHGIAPPPGVAGAIQANINWHAANDPDNLYDALAIQSGLYARMKVDEVENMGADALLFARNIITQDSTMPAGDRAALVKAIDARSEQVEAAYRTGNRQTMRGLSPNLSASQIEQNWNIPPGTLPVFATQHVSEAYQRALNTGNGIQELTPLLEEATLAGATAGDVVHTAMEAVKQGEMDASEGSAFSMAIFASASGVPHLADRALFDGGFTASDPALSQLDFISRMKDKDAYRAIDAMAMGNPQARTSLRNALNNMYRAEVARSADGIPKTGDEKKAAEAIIRELASIPIVNIRGSHYPLAMFGSDENPNMRSETIRQIERAVRAKEEDTGMAMRIVPDGAGSFSIFAGQSDTILLDNVAPENVEEVRDQTRVSTAQKRDYAQQELSDPKWLKDFTAEMPFLKSQTQREQFSTSITKAANKHGVPIVDARRFAIAVMQSPEEDRAGRRGQLSIPEAALYMEQRADAAYRPDRAEQFEDATNDKAVELYSELRDVYKDERKALAAYWAGQATVDEFVELYGNRWLSEMPTPAREFVDRAMNANTENMGYVPLEAILDPRVPDPRLQIEFP